MLGEAGVDQDFLPLHSPPSVVSLQHLSQTRDPTLLVSLEQPNLTDGHEDISAANYGLPTYQANASRTDFDFSPMEEFAAAEKKKLGLGTPTTRFATSTTRGKVTPINISSSTLGQENLPRGEPSESTSLPLRQRKLSTSTPYPRQRKGIGAKMALFESTSGEPPSSLSARLGHILSGQPELSYDIAGVSGTSGLPPTGILNTGHDRPLRFSFYSNALSTTLNARSLSELPPAGQTFEELFSGIHPPSDDIDLLNDRRHNFAFSSNPASRASPAPGVYGGFQRPPDPSPAASSNLRRSIGLDAKIGEPALTDNDTDSNTWWLDVQNPTDEEMKMLSKARFQFLLSFRRIYLSLFLIKVFFIHPLTTEDILMEETREKIELFRNYYFVCFRSFDQDPYSPTHLEPLNMYIIVFREGTLTVSIMFLADFCQVNGLIFVAFQLYSSISDRRHIQKTCGDVSNGSKITSVSLRIGFHMP
jgi:magnesium transporter